MAKVLTNPLKATAEKIRQLRAERETVERELEELQSEKEAIQETLQIVLHDLVQRNEVIERHSEKLRVFDRALEDMSYAYHEILVAAGAPGFEAYSAL